IIFDINGESTDSHYNIKSLLTVYNPYYSIKFPKDILQDGTIFPSVTITLRAATSCDFRYREGLDKTRVNQIIDLIIEHLSKLGKSLCFLYVPKDIQHLRDYLLNNEYWEIPLGARYFIPAMSREEYLNIFNSRKRSKIKKELDKLTKYNLTISKVDCNDENLKYFIKCLKQNFEKHGFKNFSYDYAYNRTKKIIEEIGKENVFFHELRHNGQKVGISIDFIHDQVLHAYQIGFEYEKLKKEWSAYFQLGFYNSIFISTKFKNIKYIQIYDGLDEAKISRGFIPEILYAYIKKDNHLFNSKSLKILNKTISNKIGQLIKQYSKNIKI
ncbi:GNAT family N-acetyltransferase, partial [Anoxybacillus kestanbolensis]|uniref:peptidogalycan biosysnthesis protein n=1 Tax=Anoxybacillus kestanbolensis TaxID=227476 RepID=UPI00208DD955